MWKPSDEPRLQPAMILDSKLVESPAFDHRRSSFIGTDMDTQRSIRTFETHCSISMANLPVFEGLAIFAKGVEVRSFARATAALNISKATVSKAVSRIEMRLGARLINRTSRQLALTDAGRQLVGRAAN